MPDTLFVALPLRKVQNKTKNLRWIFSNQHAAGQYRHTSAIFPNKFFFVRRTNARSFELAPRLCVEFLVFARRQSLPSQLLPGEFFPCVSDDPKKDIVGLGDQFR